LKVLDKLSLKVTPPNEFNDPFEFSPIVKTSDPKAAGRERLNRILADPSFYNKNRSAFASCKDFADFKSFVQSKLDFFEQDLAKRLTNLDAEFQNDVLPFLSSHYGVICFSAMDCDPLMWAHYATSHSGLMLEFAADCPLFQGGAFFVVDYHQDRAIYDPSLPADGKQVVTLARRKSTHWGYEKEYRVVVKLADTKQVTISGAKPLYLQAINAKWITSVTVGCKCPDTLKAAVSKLLARTDLNHIARYQIEMDRGQFQLLRKRL
jgi:hypothetical protein